MACHLLVEDCRAFELCVYLFDFSGVSITFSNIDINVNFGPRFGTFWLFPHHIANIPFLPHLFIRLAAAGSQLRSPNSCW